MREHKIDIANLMHMRGTAIVTSVLIRYPTTSNKRRGIAVPRFYVFNNYINMKKLFLFAVTACLIGCKSDGEREGNVGVKNLTMDVDKDSLSSWKKLGERGINLQGMKDIKILKQEWINDSIHGVIDIIQYQYTTEKGNNTVVTDTIP